MEKENNLTRVTPQDMEFIEGELLKDQRPLSLHELVEKLAYQKTSTQRVQEVKIYDPLCVYKVGDLIYKEYDENLPVGSKVSQHFRGAVVLRIINKTFYPAFNCEMLEVDYSGGGVFRKYIDYMKKAKTQVLLPSNIEGKALAPQIMERAEDPRLSELPMTEKDLKTLEKNLKAQLCKSPRFFSWNDYWQLETNRVEIGEEKVKDIEAHLLETRTSAATENLVQKFFGLEPSHNRFDLYCLSLNTVLENKFKKDFLYVSPLNWGKWYIKDLLNSLLENLPLSATMATLPTEVLTEKPQLSVYPAFPIKIYLTWREILSGGVRVPKSLGKELASSREYIFTDADEGKSYTVYYYPAQGFFLGLKDFFAANNVPQGTSLTLEKKGPAHFHFWLKKSKKKLAVLKLSYDPREDKFYDSGEEVFTYYIPNKIIYLDRETITRLLPLYGKRDNLNLRQLLELVFENFSLEASNFSLHYLRAYHLVDILKQTTQEDVEITLLNSLEFSRSEKKKGIFFFHRTAEIRVIEAEVIPAIASEVPHEIPAEVDAETLEIAEANEEIREVEVPPRMEPLEPEQKVRMEIPLEEKKEKPFRKKKLRIEGEKVPRPRKSERKVIEEKIELEELEQEVLSAIKEKEAEAAPEEREAIEPVHAKDKKEEFKPAHPGGPGFGIFAEKLKSALKKKEDKK